MTELAERLEGATTALRNCAPRQPKVAIVLGSGLGAFADQVGDALVIPYSEIPGMPVSSVAGHAGKMVVGEVAGLNCAVMQGRVHLYEGHSASDVVFGLRCLLDWGAELVILTNAAGGVSPLLEPGDLMVIEDHLNLTGANPLVGVNEASAGPRFPDMTRSYDAVLRALALRVGAAQGTTLRSGVYAGLLGPSYETPAEIRMLQRLGADAVGMSTVLETIAARHRGARVLGISCITNKGAGLSAHELSHAEVQDTGARVRDTFVSLLRGVVSAIARGEHVG